MTDLASPATTLGSPSDRTFVIQPGKLVRIASVARAMLDEARDAPCDPAGCERLRAIYLRTVEALSGLLSSDLRAELSHLVLPFETVTPTSSELRVAQAELVGWLEGLMTGVVGAIAAIEQEARPRGNGAVGRDELPGQYL